jgi:hypothetical protein
MSNSIDSNRAPSPTKPTFPLRKHYDIVNQTTGPADPKIKNEVMQEMLNRYGEDQFRAALGVMLHHRLKFTWQRPERAEIAAEHIPRFFEEELKKLVQNGTE